MITASQCLADILKAGFCHSAAQIHDNLAWINNFLAALCGHDVKRGKVKMIGNDLDDEFRGYFLLVARRNDVFQCFFSQFNVDLTVFLQLGKGNDLGECAFQLTNIGLDVGGNVLDYFIIYIVTLHFLFLAEDCHSGFIVRRLDVYGQTPFETGTQPFFQGFNLFWRFIG